ncbi:MAG: hypothetical protein K9N09_05635 [Candidatus Cloacimonetes bacterium]|nr:hypothetical protein [Candidatus Cloacimonadota bacterium]MCF7814713.1 hypothetical protein [Candidatus Cloacimonadota bacterium]MCF7868166.1 hypothetical protein [Candidatus Cloacimonadota bacterium]MCF7884482.1 hypothetical protein [Candidatus Cloacimonadota bacterium]
MKISNIILRLKKLIFPKLRIANNKRIEELELFEDLQAIKQREFEPTITFEELIEDLKNKEKYKHILKIVLVEKS